MLNYPIRAFDWYAKAFFEFGLDFMYILIMTLDLNNFLKFEYFCSSNTVGHHDKNGKSCQTLRCHINHRGLQKHPRKSPRNILNHILYFTQFKWTNTVGELENSYNSWYLRFGAENSCKFKRFGQYAKIIGRQKLIIVWLCLAIITLPPSPPQHH